MKTSVTTRDVGDVKLIELHGKITIGAGDLQMREAIHAAVGAGATKILVDMKDVTTIDSSGVGELVGCYTTATHKGKLLNLPPKISDVLTVTQLITVFDVFSNEKDGLASFG
jgi:anti-sigma B factor antagonist